MQKLMTWFFGTVIGGIIGVITVLFFSPVDGEEFRENLREHYQSALEAGRKAGAEKRAELEAELEAMSGRTSEQPSAE